MPLEPSTTPSHVLTVSQQNYGLTVEENNWDLTLAYAAISVVPNSITSSTTSNGTANLSISNVTTATATVSGTLTANHIHGNLAGSVYAHVRAGETLAKGDPVYVSGFHGSGSTLIAEVSKADASNAAKMPAVGIMDAIVTQHQNGHMVVLGTITDFNTAAYAINAELYVGVGGGMVATPPSDRAQPIARVERSNTNNGAIIVTIGDLSATNATNNTLVRRDATGTAKFSGLAIPSFTSGNVVTVTTAGAFANTSRSGIDSRTSFPNTDVTNATSLAIANRIVKRDGIGDIAVSGLIANTISVGDIDASGYVMAGGFESPAITLTDSVYLDALTYVFGAGADQALKDALGITFSNITDSESGTAYLNLSTLALSEPIVSGLQPKLVFTANPTAVGDGQQILWQWYDGTTATTTASISSEATGSTTDKLIFQTTTGGSLGTSLDLTNELATFSGAIAATDSITIDGVEVAKVVDPVRTTLTGNGSTSVYAIGGASGLTNPSALIVAIDGVLQEPTVDYGVGSGNITFTSPLSNGSKAVVISPTNTIQVGQVTPSDGSVTSSKIASGVTLVSPTITGPANLTSQDSNTEDRVMNRSLSDSRVIKNRVEGKARVFTLMNLPNALGGSVNQLAFPSFVEMAITAANTHSGYLFCDLNPHTDWSGAGFNFARNFLCSGVFYLRGIGDQNSSLRFFIGTPASYRSNQAALATAGLCLEFRRNGSNLEARLAYYATTYIETAWVTAYATGTYFNSVFRFVVRNTGNGNVSVYFLASGDTGSTKPLPDIDGTPLISVTNGPTISGGRSLAAAFCADTTLTPAANSQARVQHFDAELLS